MNKEIETFIANNELESSETLYEWYCEHYKLHDFVKKQRELLKNMIEDKRVTLSQSQYFEKKSMLISYYVTYFQVKKQHKKLNKNERGELNSAYLQAKYYADLSWLLESIHQNLAILNQKIDKMPTILSEESFIPQAIFFAQIKHTLGLANIYLQGVNTQEPYLNALLSLYAAMLGNYFDVANKKKPRFDYDELESLWDAHKEHLQIKEKKHIFTLRMNLLTWELHEGSINAYSQMFKLYEEKEKEGIAKYNLVQMSNLLIIGMNLDKITWLKKEYSLLEWTAYLKKYIEEWKSSEVKDNAKRIFEAYEAFFQKNYVTTIDLLEKNVEKEENAVLDLGMKVLKIGSWVKSVEIVISICASFVVIPFNIHSNNIIMNLFILRITYCSAIESF